MIILECYMVGKVCSWVHSLQGPILALVYIWYINTQQNERKNKINLSIHIRTFTILYAQYTHKNNKRVHALSGSSKSKGDN